MEKKVERYSTPQFKLHAPGFSSIDMFQNEYGFEPFLVFTEFHMDRSIFGPHPHAGMSVMTYMLPDSKGSFLNRDSMGDHSIIEPGGIHVTQAGSGIKHDEVPTVMGTDCHGFQIWINHADKDRLVAPKAFHASSKDVPEYLSETALVRVIQGKFEDLQSPIQLVTETVLLDILLQPNSAITLHAKEMAFVYLMKGTLTIGGNDFTGTSMIGFEEDGDTITITTTKETAHFMYASGTPHREPIVYGGPFVMTTAEQLKATQLRMQRGEMGTLNPL